MRVVVAGQRTFGRDVLELVIRRGCDVAAVSCPAGDRLWIAAQNHGLRVIEPRDFNAASMPSGCDLILAAHCHSFISTRTRHRAELGALGYHPSLLPRHRGRSAIEWAIRFGEHITGGTVYWLNNVVDGGPIAAQDWCFIRPGDTALDLWRRELAPMGLRLFARVLDLLDQNILPMEPQDRALATWEPAIENVPPLWRPDALMLGSSRYTTVTTRGAA